MSILGNREAFIRLAEREPDEPVVMLNLLKFKEGDGAASYATYGDTASRLIEERGGRVLWRGKPFEILIGDEDADAWDAVILVEYPSGKAFLDMIRTDTYNEAHEHREAGLERTKLLAMTQTSPRS